MFDKEFLNRQKARLLAEKENILKQLSYVSQDDPFSDPDRVNDNSIESDAKEQEMHMITEAEKADLNRILADIEIALAKIEKGNYGYCEKTNQPIDIRRLEVLPWARVAV